MKSNTVSIDIPGAWHGLIEFFSDDGLQEPEQTEGPCTSAQMFGWADHYAPPRTRPAYIMRQLCREVGAQCLYTPAMHMRGEAPLFTMPPKNNAPYSQAELALGLCNAIRRESPQTVERMARGGLLPADLGHHPRYAQLVQEINDAGVRAEMFRILERATATAPSQSW